MLLTLKLISNRIRDAKQKCGIIQNPKFENRIYSNFESRMEHLNILNEADVELKSKLQDQMKFLTALGILSRTHKTRILKLGCNIHVTRITFICNRKPSIDNLELINMGRVPSKVYYFSTKNF